MIVKRKYEYDINDEYMPSVNTAYYGIDAIRACTPDMRGDIARHLFKDCTVDDKEGIIIGFEDNNQYMDYYYIVYVPSLDEVVYRLVNDPEFVKSIKA